MNERVVHVAAPSRLHFGMFSFGQAGQRQFGGVGAMIEGPGVKLTVSASPQPSAEGACEVSGPGAERVKSFAQRVFQSWKQVPEPNCRIEVHSLPGEHVGLGVGTQLAMATAAGLHAFFDRPWSGPEELAESVGRGERSAIGLYGFQRGGLLVEAGKRHREEISPLIAQVALPAAWRFVLITPKRQVGLSGALERRAFERLPPVPIETTAELCRLALLHLVPSAARADFDDFSRHLYQFGYLAGTCFAAEQGGAYASPGLEQLVERLRAQGVEGVGQSSWGPTLFAVLPEQSAAEALVRWLGAEPQYELELCITSASPCGARLDVLE